MIIACDIGLKRIGLAMGVQGIVLPLEPILRHSRKQASQELQALLDEKKPSCLVVGLPSENYTDTRKRVLHFVGLLDFAPIVFINECNTSAEALGYTHHLKAQKRQNARKDGKLDSLAACEILKRYQEMLV
ncbi:RuvX/YqgF family protein [Helicobacter ailurogastricus]|uniref:Putative Holliday junction resolvase YggF n=1 Tax=Helicobacter ailurogastricus TaxID=1578720 RepID=A0A0K2Y3P1_9HELI|nr:RuvX/YqgF family protein [Helicobacter ailurogastricus]BDQ28400.1 putative pre-16S rRNA nuclease [Helicobacter ailurogastricus]GLH58398.1 Holliday junction resolvase-like protein RuvX [Helicobacter ailurogastricus]GLH59488.1 Holliday junction resolvase-like protein RuvX [Helicobacter ailurogastricus]CRF52937.1 Putative Holliday junction resolvase YggF [Helicobacter ailurogastricus]